MFNFILQSAEFFQYWKKHYAEEHHEATTGQVTEDVFRRIDLALGHLRIDKIEPRHILKFYEQLKAPDASANDTPLSQTYIRKHASVLKTLLTAAYQWGYVVSNPCEKVKLPKAGRTQKKVPTEDELHQFFVALDGHPILKHRLWVILGFSLGLRREEIFGLRWQEISFSKQTLTVSLAAVYVPKQGILAKDTKTDHSYRTLSLPPDVTAMLELWRTEVQETAKRRNKRNKVVALDDPVGPEKWVFPQADGSIGHPHAFTTFLRRFCQDHNLFPVSPHQLRHLSGSYLLNAGVDLAAVSAKLGHGDKSFTLKTYIHELQSAEKHSSIVMQGILDNIKKKVSGKKARG